MPSSESLKFYSIMWPGMSSSLFSSTTASTRFFLLANVWWMLPLVTLGKVWNRSPFTQWCRLAFTVSSRSANDSPSLASGSKITNNYVAVYPAARIFLFTLVVKMSSVFVNGNRRNHLEVNVLKNKYWKLNKSQDEPCDILHLWLFLAPLRRSSHVVEIAQQLS